MQYNKKSVLAIINSLPQVPTTPPPTTTTGTSSTSSISTVETLCYTVAKQLGRTLQLVPVPSPRIPSGLYVKQTEHDIIFYKQSLDPIHKEHVILHELYHMITGTTLPFESLHQGCLAISDTEENSAEYFAHEMWIRLYTTPHTSTQQESQLLTYFYPSTTLRSLSHNSSHNPTITPTTTISTSYAARCHQLTDEQITEITALIANLATGNHPHH